MLALNSNQPPQKSSFPKRVDVCRKHTAHPRSAIKFATSRYQSPGPIQVATHTHNTHTRRRTSRTYPADPTADLVSADPRGQKRQPIASASALWLPLLVLVVEALVEQWVRGGGYDNTHTHTYARTHTHKLHGQSGLSTTPREPSSSSWPHYLPLPPLLPDMPQKKSIERKKLCNPCKPAPPSTTPLLPRFAPPEYKIKASSMRKKIMWSSRYLPYRSSVRQWQRQRRRPLSHLLSNGARSEPGHLVILFPQHHHQG